MYDQLRSDQLISGDRHNNSQQTSSKILNKQPHIIHTHTSTSTSPPRSRKYRYLSLLRELRVRNIQEVEQQAHARHLAQKECQMSDVRMSNVKMSYDKCQMSSASSSRMAVGLGRRRWRKERKQVSESSEEREIHHTTSGMNPYAYDG